MEDLIPIIDFHGQEGIQAVSARALYESLFGEDIHRNFAKWAEKSITSNEYAVRGEDWVCVQLDASPNGGKIQHDYHLRIDFAKKLGMMARSDRGEEIRDYFIAVEARARQVSLVGQISRKDLAKWLLESEEAKERALAALEAAKPAISFHKQVTASEGWMSLKKAAAVLAIPGLGQNKLFKFLRDWEVLMGDNTPMRRHIDSGCFRVQEFPNRYKAGHMLFQTMVSQKGLDFILRQWNKNLVVA